MTSFDPNNCLLIPVNTEQCDHHGAVLGIKRYEGRGSGYHSASTSRYIVGNESPMEAAQKTAIEKREGCIFLKAHNEKTNTTVVNRLKLSLEIKFGNLVSPFF